MVGQLRQPSPRRATPAPEGGVRKEGPQRRRAGAGHAIKRAPEDAVDAATNAASESTKKDKIKQEEGMILMSNSTTKDDEINEEEGILMSNSTTKDEDEIKEEEVTLMNNSTTKDVNNSTTNDENEIEEGSIDDLDAERAEYEDPDSHEEGIKMSRRLYKKRANMALALYHQNHPGEQYRFLRVRISDVFYFQENRLKHPFYMHMNFVAADVETGSEKLFFAELGLLNHHHDPYSGYVATCCQIVDENSAGGRNYKCFFPDGCYPPDKFDGENCYACALKIKHPLGSTYRAGHTTTTCYDVVENDVE